jgi:hypothetical protein
MASPQTLGDALKRVARYSQITNEALVVRYGEANGPIISLSYSGVPRHSDRHQIEFCTFTVFTNVPRADRAEPRAATLLHCSFSIGRHRAGELAAPVGFAPRARALVVLPAVPAKPL